MAHLVKLCGRSSLPLFPFPPAAPSCPKPRMKTRMRSFPGSRFIHPARRGLRGDERSRKTASRSRSTGGQSLRISVGLRFPINVAPTTFYLHWLAGSVGRSQKYGVWCFTERSINKGGRMFYGILRVTRFGCRGLYSSRYASHRDCPALFHAMSHVSARSSPQECKLWFFWKTLISPVDNRLVAKIYLIETLTTR